MLGKTLGHYEMTAELGKGGPASARDMFVFRELQRGLAEAKPRTRA